MISAQLLLIVVTLWIAFLTWKFSVNREGVQINHCTLCGFGFIFYWLVPMAVGLFHLMEGDAVVGYWRVIFNILSETQIDEFFLLTAVISGAFFWGSKIGMRDGRKTRLPYRAERFNVKLLALPLVCGVGFSAIYGYLVRDSLFHGYTQMASLDTNGPFVAGTVFLFAVTLIYGLRNMEMHPQAPFSSFFKNPYFAAYALFALLVLSMGERLYVLSAVVMLLVAYSNYFKRINLVQLGLIIAIAGILVGLLGVIRLKSGPAGGNVVAMIFYEPLLTSLSLIASLKQGIHELIRFPVYLLSDFTNMVPSALVGAGKAHMRLDPTDDGFTIFSPLGALNSYVSFMINFGDLGTIICFFLFGYGLSRLKEIDLSMRHRLVYIMLSGWIAFTFFRDDFSISLVKTMLEFSVLVPVGVIYALRWLSANLFAGSAVAISPIAETDLSSQPT